MNRHEPRKRIPYVKKGLPAIEDGLAFIKNKSSDYARRIFGEVENTHIELWFDKHYHDRHQHGDEDGKREGIDPKTVENLVKRSLKHLLFYSSAVAGFKFMNFSSPPPPVRVVLQEESNGSKLNVVIEAHCLAINNCEITVKTAMCTDDFRIAMSSIALKCKEMAQY